MNAIKAFPGIRKEGFVRIAGLSESQKAQRTQKTLKEEGNV